MANPICNIFCSPSLLIKNHNLQNFQEKDILLMGRSLLSLHTFVYCLYLNKESTSPFLENFGVSEYFQGEVGFSLKLQVSQTQ